MKTKSLIFFIQKKSCQYPDNDNNNDDDDDDNQMLTIHEHT